MLVFEESTRDPPAIRETTGAGLSAPSKDAAKKKSAEIIKKVIERDTKFKLL